MHNFSPFSVKIYTYIQFWGWQGGSTPLPMKILYLVGLICIILGPFLVQLFIRM